LSEDSANSYHSSTTGFGMSASLFYHGFTTNLPTYTTTKTTTALEKSYRFFAAPVPPPPPVFLAAPAPSSHAETTPPPIFLGSPLCAASLSALPILIRTPLAMVSVLEGLALSATGRAGTLIMTPEAVMTSFVGPGGRGGGGGGGGRGGFAGLLGGPFVRA